MNNPVKHVSLILLFLPTIGFTAPLIDGTYWRCVTRDNTYKEWFATNAYQKVAINNAFAACKKESQSPMTCKTTPADCEGFNQNLSTRALWRCTALDKVAAAWNSNFYRQRDDAAMAAKVYCKDNSTVPDTCYVNLVTCNNLNEKAKL